MAARRAAETFEETEQRRFTNARRSSARRAIETPEESQQRRDINARRTSLSRAIETPEDSQLRRDLNARRNAARRAVTNADATAERRRYDATMAATRRAGEDNQELARRQSESRERMAASRARRNIELSESWRALMNYQQRLRITEIRLTTHNCDVCGVLLYSGETSSFCCLNGKIGLAPLPTLPVELRRIYEDRTFKIHA